MTDRLADRTRQIVDSWHDTLKGLRSDSAARAMLPLLIAHPVLSAPDAGDLLGVSNTAAANALQTLADHGVLEPVQARTPGAGRNRNWYAATELVNLWSH